MNPDAAKWNVTEVGKWLESRDLREHVRTFKDNDINGNLLLRLDKVGAVLQSVSWVCGRAGRTSVCLPVAAGKS